MPTIYPYYTDVALHVEGIYGGALRVYATGAQIHMNGHDDGSGPDFSVHNCSVSGYQDFVYNHQSGISGGTVLDTYFWPDGTSGTSDPNVPRTPYFGGPHYPPEGPGTYTYVAIASYGIWGPPIFPFNYNYLAGQVGVYTLIIHGTPLTGSFTASDKVFDNTTAATVLTRSLSGVVPGDSVTLTGGTATFNTAAVGTGKTVTLTGATLTGTDAYKYELTSVNTTTADIVASSNWSIEPKIAGGGDPTTTGGGGGGDLCGANVIPGFGTYENIVVTDPGWRPAVINEDPGFTTFTTTAEAIGAQGGAVTFLHRHLPTENESASELWAGAPSIDNLSYIITRKTTTWGQITPKDNFEPDFPEALGVYAQSLHGKMFIAYKPADGVTDRLHVWDGSSLRRTGLPAPNANPSAANAGVDSYAATLRYYRTRWIEKSGSVILRRSEPTDNGVSF